MADIGLCNRSRSPAEEKKKYSAASARVTGLPSGTAFQLCKQGGTVGIIQLSPLTIF